MLYQFHRLRSQVHVFDFDTRSVVQSSDVDWPIIWVLCRYTLKHIFQSSRRLNTAVYNRALGSFCDSVRWRWFFRNEGAQEDCGFRLRRETAKFIGQTCPALEAWLSRFRGRVVEGVRHADVVYRRAGCKGNMLPLDKLGIKLLSCSKWFPIRNDKEGGFTLHRFDVVSQVFQNILNKPCYIEVDPSMVVQAELQRKYRELCSRIVKVRKDDALARPLRKSIGGPIFASLTLTTKSTKPAGAVTHRNVHACRHNGFEGLSAFVEHRLEIQLSRFDWLLSSTHDLVERLGAMECRSGDLIARIDVKEFFMTGEFSTITHEALKCMPKGLDRTCVREAVDFLLRNQFLNCAACPSQLWKVRQGSGMGLRHSAALCDCAFAGVAELGFTNNPLVRAKFKIWTYFRFRDDIFIHCGDRALLEQFLHIYAQRAGRLYSLEIVSIGTSGDMLAATVDLRPPRFSVAPRAKNHGPVLCARSAHPASIRSWPIGHIISTLKMCTPDRIPETIAGYIHRFQDHWAPVNTIALLEHVARRFTQGCFARRKPKRDDTSCSHAWWLVLPFHLSLDRTGLGRVVRDFCRNPFFRAALRDAFCSDRVDPEVRVSWGLGRRNISTHIASSSMRRYNLWKEDGVGGGGPTNKVCP